METVLCLFLALLSIGGSVQPVKEIRSASDVEFARAAFTALANGESAAEGYIDWPHFVIVSENVGKEYNSMPSEAAKAAYRAAFVKSFGREFRKTGARAWSYKNWRLQSHNSTLAVVAATPPSGTPFLITLTLNKNGRKIQKMEYGAKPH